MFSKTVLFIYFIFCGLFILWLNLLGLPLTSILIFLLFAAFIPINILNIRVLIARACYFCFMLLPLAICTWHVPFHEFGHRVTELDKKIRTHGAAGFSTSDKVAVYGLNIVMAGGGYVAGFPEVATETLLLTVPNNGEMTLNSDFAMRSPKVRRALVSMSRGLDSLPPSVKEANLGTKTIYWASDKDIWTDSVRVGLATNPLKINVKARRVGNTWALDCVGQVSVKYPRGGKVVLIPNIKGKDLVMSEGLYWVLQENGWLFPYKMNWAWSVKKDDHRFKDLRNPDAFVGERVLLFLWDTAGKGSFF